jgi:nucleotide-binding universal stress UspA family protein
MIKHLATVVDDPDLAREHVRAAVRSAHAIHADLAVTMLTAAPMIAAELAPFGGLYLPEAELRADAREDMMRLRGHLNASDRHIKIGGFYGDVSWLAHELRGADDIADLILIGPAASWSIPWLRRHTIGTLLMTAATPLLLMPAGHSFAPIRRAVLGWKPSAEATRAMRDLMALAEPGAHIDIIMVEKHAENDDELAGSRGVAAYLESHGFEVACHSVGRELSTADQLQYYTLDTEADLLAVGAYAHSRIREVLFGGVTRDLISAARVPVLLTR